MQDEDRECYESSFWRCCQADFASFENDLRALLEVGWRLQNGLLVGGARAFDRRCAQFFEECRPPWERYDTYLLEWPPEPDPYEQEDEPPERDTREMGKLLAHRITMAYLAERRRRRYVVDAEHRPVWRLSPIQDGRTPQRCLVEAAQPHHWQSEYWQRKTLPCEALFCRCRIVAMTLREAIEF